MTHVFNSTPSSYIPTVSVLKVYIVEVITFEGESHTECVEAYTEEEAQALAAAMHTDVDYTMINGSWLA